MRGNEKQFKEIRLIIVLLSVIIILLFGVIILLLAKGDKQPSIPEPNKIENKEVEEKEEPEEELIEEDNEEVEEDNTVTDAMNKELRNKIPTIKYCNQYLYKQYNGGIFKASDLSEEDKKSNFNECQGALGVYHLEQKAVKENDMVYIYDYVLLYNQQGTEEENYFGTSVNNIKYKYDTIGNVTDDKIQKYGQLYKYSFKIVETGYEYISTEIVQ